MSTCSCSHTVSVVPKISVLANDYSGLVNLPSVNGVTVQGDLTAQDLNLLSSSADSYETVTLDAAKEDGGYIVVLSKDTLEASKIDLTSFVSSLEAGSTGTTTADTLDEDAEIGSYQYVLID